MDHVAQALRTALEELGDDLRPLLESVAQPGEGEAAAAELGEDAVDQLLRAFRSLLFEAFEGGSEQRDFVIDTAVPALVARGQTSLELLEGHVQTYVVLAPHLVAAVPAALRDDAAVWLARYASTYTCQVVQRAQAAERDAAAAAAAAEGAA